MNAPTTTAIKIDPDGSATVIDLGKAVYRALTREINCPRIDVANRITGTHADLVLDMWVDAEGIEYASAPNPVGSTVADTLVNHRLKETYYGTVVFAAADAEDTVVSLHPDQQIAVLAAVIAAGGNIASSQNTADMHDVTELASTAGFQHPVAIATHAWARTITWDYDDTTQTETDRLRVVLTAASAAFQRAVLEGDDTARMFTIRRVSTPDGQPEPVDLWVRYCPADDGPVFTITHRNDNN